ncbi:dihydroorotase [Carnimonas bestiolae]|uniref:dihydroorotase n=1 Tax=Carnimonas bestiolae TaxID=3402172 RepID=UPI003EDC3632
MTSASAPEKLTLRRPDDWHLHLRDGAMLKAVLPSSSAHFGRAIIMPNLVPPITSVDAAIAYRERIIAAIPATDDFTPLMTCYLTDTLSANELERGHREGVFTAAKLYPANATTNSSHGVSDIANIHPLLETMQRIDMPLLIHGEVTAPDIDIFDREARFIESVLEPLRKHFPALRIVMEHITTRDAADYVQAGNEYLAATITPQHLRHNRNDMLVGGIKPHLYCLPILKRNVHQQALRALVASGFERVFLGTDSAPHPRHAKENTCGCAGVFNAPAALGVYAEVFEEEHALQHLEAFCSLNGPRFYKLPVNQGTIDLVRQETHYPDTMSEGDTLLHPFIGGASTRWGVDTTAQ